jgi:homoprotocatechuate degradation regulator HpaR
MTMRDFSQSLPMLLLRSHQAVMTRFRPVLRRHRITEQQWRVLRALSSVDEARITRIAELTLISKPSLSRLLPALEARGLIRRSAAADDLRGTSVRIAPAGLALIDAVSPYSEARYRAIERHIGAEAMAALYTLLPRLAERAEASPAAAGPDAAPATRAKATKATKVPKATKATKATKAAKGADSAKPAPTRASPRSRG